MHKRSSFHKIGGKIYQIRYNYHRTLESQHYKTKKGYKHHSCLRKFPYSEEEAETTAFRMNNHDETVIREVHHYKCDFCEYWHVGRVRIERPHKNQPRHEQDRFHINWDFELGTRVAGCLLHENQAKRKYLRKLFASALKKRYNGSI